MTRALLALLLLVGGGSPFLSVPGKAVFLKAVAAADGSGPRTNAGGRFDPNGVLTSQEETDTGNRFDPNG